jgi:hypothetical protein
MIVTIVTLIPCVALARLGTQYSGTGKVPGGVLTGLGWSPAGPLNASEPPVVNIGVGFSSTTYFFSAQRPAPAWVTALGLPSLNPQLPAFEQLRTTQQLGIPIPWLTRTVSLVSAGDDQKPGNASKMHAYVTGLHLGPIEDTGATPRTFALDFLTMIPDPLGFLLNTVIFSTLWMPITAWHRRRRAKRGGCKRCGYSREGLAQDTICPECGQKPVH